MSQLISLRKVAVSLATFAIVSLAAFNTARADTVYNLTFNNFGQVGSLGTITTHLITSGTDIGCIQVSVVLDPNYVIHGNDALGFNVASGFTGVVIKSLSSSTFTLGDGGTFDGFGSRTYSIDGQTTSVARANPVQNFSFVVCASTPFTNSNQVFDFAAQIALITANGATGFAASGPQVPEPASMILMGSGLLGLATGLRGRFRKGQSKKLGGD